MKHIIFDSVIGSSADQQNPLKIIRAP